MQLPLNPAFQFKEIVNAAPGIQSLRTALIAHFQIVMRRSHGVCGTFSWRRIVLLPSRRFSNCLKLVVKNCATRTTLPSNQKSLPSVARDVVDHDRVVAARESSFSAPRELDHSCDRDVNDSAPPGFFDP